MGKRQKEGYAQILNIKVEQSATTGKRSYFVSLDNGVRGELTQVPTGFSVGDNVTYFIYKDEITLMKQL